VILGILREHVPGVVRDGAPAVEVGELKAELAAIRGEITALRELLETTQRDAQESA
jgi:hypothetical protein